MSKPNYLSFSFAISVIVMVVATVCGAFILHCSLPLYVKWPWLLVVWFLAATLARGLLIYEKDRYSESLMEFVQLKDQRIQQLQDKLIHTEFRESDRIMDSRQNWHRLEQYRSRFPCVIAEGYTLYTIVRTEIVVSSHSRWLLVGEYRGELWECNVLRPDTQTHMELLDLAAATQEPRELNKLDQSHYLLWK